MSEVKRYEISANIIGGDLGRKIVVVREVDYAKLQARCKLLSTQLEVALEARDWGMVANVMNDLEATDD